MLVAMATGTGKTYTTVNQIYRLMKSGVARRILFLVDPLLSWNLPTKDP
jgi:type I restriction enzyme R subunit